MNRFKKFLFLVLLIFVITGLSGFAYYKIEIEPNKTKAAVNMLAITDKFKAKQLDTIYQYCKMMNNKTSLSIAYIDGNTISYYGIIRRNDTLFTVNTEDSLYALGSISKVFTSTLLSNLVLNKTLSLDDNIDKLLGYPLKNNLAIKLKDLSNHTSGLDRVEKGAIMNTLLNPYQPYSKNTKEWLIKYLKEEIDIDKDKKGKSNYSNLGMGILGYGMEQYTHTEYHNLLRQYIFNKYGMNHSFAEGDTIRFSLFKIYNAEDSIIDVWKLNSMKSAGGVYSTTRDMSKFALAQMDSSNKELFLTQKETVKIDKNKGVGMGWHILYYPKNTYLFHNGAIGFDGGYTSSMSIQVQNKKAIVILSSIDIMSINSNLDKLNISLLENF